MARWSPIDSECHAARMPFPLALSRLAPSYSLYINSQEQYMQRKKQEELGLLLGDHDVYVTSLPSTNSPSSSAAAAAAVHGFGAARPLQPGTGYPTSSYVSEATMHLYAATTRQADSLPTSTSTSVAHREAANHRYNLLGIEQCTLPSATSNDLRCQNSFYYGVPRQQNSVDRREGQLYPPLTEFSDRLQRQPQARYFDELVRQEIINQRFTTERKQNEAPFMGVRTDDPLALHSFGGSILPGHSSLISSRTQVGNDLSIASSLSSPSALHQERMSLQRTRNDKTDHLSRQNLLPNIFMSSSYLLPPMTASAERMLRARVPTSITSPRAADGSISRPLASNQLASGERLVTLAAGSNGSRGNREQRDAFSCYSSTAFGDTTRPVPPPCVEGNLPPYSERTVLSLATNEDRFWCSDLIRFTRSDLVEVFRANGEDVAARIHNKRIVYRQVGIRCRFCAHLPRSERAIRSATFPSSIDRIQQAVSMMMREHFLRCQAMPESIKSLYKRKANQKNSAESASRKDWQRTARQLGLVDTGERIMFYADVQSPRQRAISGAGEPPLLSHSTAVTAVVPLRMLESTHQPLIEDSDRSLVSDYLYFLISQYQRISVNEIDRQLCHQRSSLPIGMAGFGCRHCCNAFTAGSRFFPQKRRTLPSRVTLLYEHLQQCLQCPCEIKVCISLLKSSAEQREKSYEEKENEKAFFSRIWARLHGHIPTGVSAECRERSETVDVEV